MLIHFLIHLSIHTQRLTQSWHLSDVEHPEDLCVYRNRSYIFLLIVNHIMNESKFGILFLFFPPSLLSYLNFSYFLLKFSYFYTIKSFVFVLSSLIYLCSRQWTEVSASMREEFLMASLSFKLLRFGLDTFWLLYNSIDLRLINAYVIMVYQFYPFRECFSSS